MIAYFTNDIYRSLRYCLMLLGFAVANVGCDPERDFRESSVGEAEFVLDEGQRSAYVRVQGTSGGDPYLDTASVTAYVTDGRNIHLARLTFLLEVSALTLGEQTMGYAYATHNVAPGAQFRYIDGGDAPVLYGLDTASTAASNSIEWTFVDHDAKRYEGTFDLDFTKRPADRGRHVEIFGDDYPLDVRIRDGRISFQLPQE